MLTIKILSIILFTYLGFYSFFWLLMTILGVGFRTSLGKTASPPPNILILLPAYKPGLIFKKVLMKVKTLEVYHPNIKVFCLMQHSEKELVELAKNYQFIVKEKAFDQEGGNSYHHALRYLVDEIQSDPELVSFNPAFTMILDKDNLIDDDFLINIPFGYYHKYQLIQGRRASISNKQSTSFFDQVSEALNDCMFRATNSRLGFLPEVSGSAALIKTEVFCKAIKHLDSNAPGYDKNFMVQLLTNDSIEGIFIPESFISEEKTDDLLNFQPQRLRWFGEQYFNALYSGGKLIKSWITGRWSSFIYLLILWRPPRSVQLFVVPFLGLLEVIIYGFSGTWLAGIPIMGISSIVIVFSVVVFLSSVRLLLPAMTFAIHLPRLVFANLVSAFSSIQSKYWGKFIHTEHKL